MSFVSESSRTPAASMSWPWRFGSHFSAYQLRSTVMLTENGLVRGERGARHVPLVVQRAHALVDEDVAVGRVLGLDKRVVQRDQSCCQHYIYLYSRAGSSGSVWMPANTSRSCGTAASACMTCAANVGCSAVSSTTGLVSDPSWQQLTRRAHAAGAAAARRCPHCGSSRSSWTPGSRAESPPPPCPSRPP